MRQRWGPLSTRFGLVGLAVLLGAFVLTAVSASAGVHCPECDRSHLTEQAFNFWKTFFLVKDGVYGAATLLLAAACPLATPRRWPFVFAAVFALLAFAMTPL